MTYHIHPITPYKASKRPPLEIKRRCFEVVDYVFDFPLLCKMFADVPLEKGSTEDFKRNYLLDQLKDKYPVGSESLPEKERESAGLRKLLAANERCREINELGYDTSVVDALTLSSILQVAANHARRILGGFSYNTYKHSAFSNGATTCRSYKKRDAYFKYNGTGAPIEVSGRALSRLRSLINCTPLWLEIGGADNIMINNMDKVTFVEKNATEKRAIVPQQSGNVCLQKGPAYQLKTCLKRVGIDLTDQSKNQELARIASISRCYATLDCKNASALMNYRVVWDIIPNDLFIELDALRNTHGEYQSDGGPKIIDWQMFSSMGNGYNFELESLLFYVLALAACEKHGDYIGEVSVYGDDIIVPLSCAPFVMEVLEAVGFEMNRKKSHINGHFRESCGAHYLNGVDVKPFYIKKEVKTISDVIRICNRIRQWCSIPAIEMCDPRYFHIWKYYSALVPNYLRGGQDVSVDYALVTHERPRFRLAGKQRVTPIFGARALLRHWQSRTGMDNVLLFRVHKIVGTDSEQVAPPHLSTIDESAFRITPNSVPTGRPCLFPAEVSLKDTFGVVREVQQDVTPIPDKKFRKDLNSDSFYEREAAWLDIKYSLD